MAETKISKTATAEESRAVLSSSLSYYRWRNIEGCPRADGFDRITCLQIDLMRWERSNFGLAKSYTSSLGVIEEIGELEDAQDDEDEWKDAIGDVLIYACNLCSKSGMDFGTLIDVALRGKPAKMAGMLGKLGKLAHVTLKADQGIRGYADRGVARRDLGIVLYRVVSSVVRYALLCGWDAREILFNVAAEVMQRDWSADPGGGKIKFTEAMLEDMVNYPGTDWDDGYPRPPRNPKLKGKSFDEVIIDEPKTLGDQLSEAKRQGWFCDFGDCGRFPRERSTRCNDHIPGWECGDIDCREMVARGKEFCPGHAATYAVCGEQLYTGSSGWKCLVHDHVGNEDIFDSGEGFKCNLPKDAS